MDLIRLTEKIILTHAILIATLSIDRPWLSKLSVVLIICIILRGSQAYDAQTLGLKPTETKWSERDTPIPSSPGVYELTKKNTDLVFNLRGIGWNWSAPRPSYKPKSDWLKQRGFYSFIHLCLLFTTHKLLQSLSHPIRFKTTDGVTHLLLQTLAGYSVGFYIYCMINGGYLFLSFLDVLMRGSDPLAYPILFHHPWLSSSFSDFWGRRWHQLFRRVVWSLGWRTGRSVPNWAGSGVRNERNQLLPLFFSYFISALLHQLGYYTATGIMDVNIGLFFLLQCPFIVIERTLIPREWNRTFFIMCMTITSPLLCNSWIHMGIW
ncbi:hypothetical protein PROFUN_08518 [Planoprotostelium fungivorum]|uniref:Wax synthase domain-containing protein n=1 Tax=Planoprotostelium fungivorum TaxID=1890364 RepID=A0A2P6NJC4_9EUKA|nr:hypothetical protein PROFUN_08518 [Planoprotostelium fungivorum]